MSDLRPASPLRRPESARPREAPAPAIEPPTKTELEAIERHLVSLPEQEGAHVEADEALGVIFVRGPGSGTDLSYAAMPRWDEARSAAALAAVRRRMRDDGAWPSLLLCDHLEIEASLQASLRRDGWMRATGETVMWVAHAAVVPHLDARLRIEAVQPRSLETHEALERRIFGIGRDQAQRRRAALSAALSGGHLRAWIVWLEEEPVAVARLSQGPGVAGLQGIGVVEDRRGQGYGTLVTTVATRAGLATGNRLVWLSVREEDAAAMRVYTRLGYQPAFRWSRWFVTEDPRRS